MVNTSLLLTGAGGVALPFLIQHLKEKGYRVLAADMDPTAAGLFLADKGFVIPKANDKNFLSSIRRICSEENVKIIIPLVDEELLSVSDLEQEGVLPLIPRKQFIELCLDKYNLIQSLKRVNIPFPETHLACDGPGGMHFPCIVKPRTGRGSREVEILQSEKSLEIWRKKIQNPQENYILQQYIEGTEYTVSVVAWRDGRVQVVVPKKILSKRGVTKLAITQHNQEIENYCTQIQKKLHADGPFNVQLRCEANSGSPLLFEINPRYSTTTSLTIHAGAEEIHGLIVQILNGSHSYSFGTWKEGLVLFRQTTDSFFNESEFSDKLRNIREML